MKAFLGSSEIEVQRKHWKEKGGVD